ncbi:MAG: DUF4282 domain-containing protein [Thermovirgaceae bacterium]|nr:DUF4282 domain-containing protein [Synergistales bacterium]HPC75863.1 DUF4282 domain-containing protein [Synergistales bacterium]HRS48579.1 DUF4282 domain-containing protein [Thermovirgaceae bacterium]HRU90832.1 DUF4282 domain-containing protein [Thermovirgaceae bacterium]
MAGLDAIIGYLNFDLLIGPAVIKVLYFAGAFVMPFAAWFLSGRISSSFPQATRSFSELAGKTGKGPRAWLLFALAVALLEMTWRVVCEYFIVCFQISQTLEYLAN